MNIHELAFDVFRNKGIFSINRFGRDDEAVFELSVDTKGYQICVWVEKNEMTVSYYEENGFYQSYDVKGANYTMPVWTDLRNEYYSDCGGK